MRLILILILILLLPCAPPAGASPPDQGRGVKSRAQPDYPPLARNMHVEGDVAVEVTVSPGGLPTRASAVTGHPLLRRAAEECAMRWRFNQGHDVSMEIVTFHFAMPS